MDYLWSPWRYRYIAGPKTEQECVFCAIAASSDDEQNLVLYRAKLNYIVLNRYPYSAGHLMVVPYTHLGKLEQTSEQTTAEMMLLMRRAEKVLGTVYHPEGLNMGINLGASAGAGVAGHIHMHVVPRWPGDANFMTTIGETRVLPEDLATTYKKVENRMRAVVAEFLGTFVLMMFGTGVVAMTVLFGKGLPGEVVNGGYTNITIAWGIAVTMGIYVSSKWSGGHLNPAVTVSLAVFRGFSWKLVVPYILAQVAGAFCAATLVFWNYRPAFQAFDPGLTKTAGVFTTFPAFPNQLSAGLLDQVIGTALLMFVILAIGEHATELGPILVGLLVIAIGMAFGGMHGYAINPARDFGPRLFTAIAGFQNNGLTNGAPVFWVPIVGPLVGGVLGSGLFEWTLGKRSHKVV